MFADFINVVAPVLLFVGGLIILLSEKESYKIGYTNIPLFIIGNLTMVASGFSLGMSLHHFGVL